MKTFQQCCSVALFAALTLVASPPQRIYDAGNYPADDSAAVYDPASDSHTDLPSMSTARMHFGLGRLGGLVCAVGGTSNGFASYKSGRASTCETA